MSHISSPTQIPMRLSPIWSRFFPKQSPTRTWLPCPSEPARTACRRMSWRLLARLNRRKPVWVELGLQTIHEESAARIQRGYSLPVFENAVRELKAAGLTVIVHVILGLPDETKAQMLDTVRYLADFQPAIDGIKLQLLHILRGTKLAELYEQAPFPVFSMDEYIELLIECIRLLPPDMVIHRISGDGPKKLLIAPEWSGNKRAFLNTFSKALRESGCFQGQDFTN